MYVCAECEGPIPDDSRPDRVTCSVRCRKARSERLRIARAVSKALAERGIE